MSKGCIIQRKKQSDRERNDQQKLENGIRKNKNLVEWTENISKNQISLHYENKYFKWKMDSFLQKNPVSLGSPFINKSVNTH